MRKGFTEENSKEMEVVLKIRVPQDFDETLEARIDEALADTLHNLGCELIDSKEYKDVVGSRANDFSLDDFRAMVKEELELNGVSSYGLTKEEVDGILLDADFIDLLAEYMDRTMYQVDGNVHRALKFVFEQYFSEGADDFREKQQKAIIDGLHLFCDASIDGGTLFIDCWKGDSVEVFLAEDGGLMCLLPDEDEPRALRDKIQDIEAGDAFLCGNCGIVRTTSESAHQNFDDADNPWILYGDDGDCYFEEDIGSVLGKKMRALLAKLPAREEVFYDIPEYPLRHYDDAVRHLCEVLNRQDEEMDLDDNFTPVKSDEFIPIFMSENYFGIYCWHDDGNEYYLIDRNTGAHTMVLSDSFEFVGYNTLDCLKDEKILNVANEEWLHYLIDFSLENVKGVVPESELGGIAVLESAWREECRKQGGHVMGMSLAERIKMATEKAAAATGNSKSDVNFSQEI